jgi:UV DNA damage endonuclease
MCDRTCRMDGFSLNRAGELALKNCKDLKRIMLWNTEHGVKMFRITSCLFPFMDHPTLGYKVEDLYESAEILKVLRETGEIAKLHDIRLSCHPGPFTTLASPNEENVKKTLLGLDMHDNIGNMLGLGEEFVINIHVGGSYDSKIKTAARFVHNFQRLNPSLKKRITLENDDKGEGLLLKLGRDL